MSVKKRGLTKANFNFKQESTFSLSLTQKMFQVVGTLCMQFESATQTENLPEKKLNLKETLTVDLPASSIIELQLWRHATLLSSMSSTIKTRYTVFVRQKPMVISHTHKCICLYHYFVTIRNTIQGSGEKDMRMWSELSNECVFAYRDEFTSVSGQQRAVFHHLQSNITPH